MKKLLFCTQKLNSSDIRRESRHGVEHIILSSRTLPADIVMNGIHYSKKERDKSFKTLNRTPVTIEHPEIDGVFVSANDPEIDFTFRFGAFNENAKITADDRISLDKVINVQKALMTEKGKRLLDRIAELENNIDAKPIHTSVGVYIDVEEVEPTTNALGQEYSLSAKDMFFDHDAILLDSDGAATPEQGTGIGVNKENVKIEYFMLNSDDELNNIPKEFHKKAKTLHSNQKVTFLKIFDEIYRQINLDNNKDEHNFLLHESVDEDSFVFETMSGEMFKSNYSVDNQGNIEVQNTRIPVERVVSFPPINSTEKDEDNSMRDAIIAELGKLGVTVNAEISKVDLMAKYKEALIAKNKGDGDDANTDDKDDKGGKELAEIVANTVKKAIEPLLTKISGLEAEIKTDLNKELDDLSNIVANSDKYPDMEAITIKSLGLEKVKSMAANCGASYSVGNTTHVNNTESDIIVTNVEDLPD